MRHYTSLKKVHVTVQYKNQKNKNIEKIDTPSIIYDHDDTAYLLANFNHEKVLIQRFGHYPPELWSLAEFKQNGVGNGYTLNPSKVNLILHGFELSF